MFTGSCYAKHKITHIPRQSDRKWCAFILRYAEPA